MIQGCGERSARQAGKPGAAAVNAARSILDRVQLLKDGSECSKQREACALRELAAIPGNRKTIAAAGAIPPLVQLLSVGNDIMKVQAALVLTQLAGNTDNKKNIAAKAVPQLVRLLSYLLEWLPRAHFGVWH
jgi:hypothetical protein